MRGGRVNGSKVSNPPPVSELGPTPPPSPRDTHSTRQLTCAPLSRGYRKDGGEQPAGTHGTAGFVPHRAFDGAVCTRTCHRYGVLGYGYGVLKPDPRVTRVEP